MSETPPVGEGYTAETKRLVEMYQSARGVKNYAELLGFENKSDLLKHLPPDALILDLGSGKGTLAKELYILRPDITTVSLNPAFSDKDFVEKQRRFSLKPRSWGMRIFDRKNIDKSQKANSRLSVSAINPKLPFRDGSFDVVLDSMSSVYYGLSHNQAHLMVNEIIRVLKPGGFAAVGPVLGKKEADELQAHLKSIKGVTFKLGKPVILGFSWGFAFQIKK